MISVTVMCALHAKRFVKIDEEHDSDNTQQLAKQYWKAECGCSIEITATYADRKVN
jgi:hypothetical protein